MEQNNNRVIRGMQDWLEREKNISELFSPNVIQGRYFQQVKLDYLRDMEKNIRPSASPDEKMTLQILRGQRRDLEKKVFPNPVARFLVKAAIAIKNLSVVQHSNSPAYERTKWMMKGTNAPQHQEQKIAAQDENLFKQINKPIPKLMLKKETPRHRSRRI